MAGNLKVDVEMKSSADKFWHGLRESDKLFPIAFPELYKSVDILEGDGKAVGSVRLVKFTDGLELIKESKEKIEAVDEEKRSVVYSVIAGEVLDFYKCFKVEVVVEPKELGCLVKWSCDFEKAKDDALDPQVFKDAAVKTFFALDAHLLNP